MIDRPKRKRLLAVYRTLVDQLDNDPENTLFVALTRHELALCTMGLLAAAMLDQSLEELSTSVIAKFNELIEVQYDGEWGPRGES